ncbi:alpha/beta hydrolase [Dyella agri]
MDASCKWLGLAVMALTAGMASAATAPVATPPQHHVYQTVGGASLGAYVFEPPAVSSAPRAAVLLFHGGGWRGGSAEWSFDDARRFAALGMVAIAIDYRLSGDKATPIDAFADTCAAFAWARRHAAELRLDPARVAGYGVSAGGHLVASAGTLACPSDTGSLQQTRPDAMLLVSPAVNTARDGWFRHLLQGRAEPAAYSPLDHAGASTPPTLIVQGEADTLTRPGGAKAFCERMHAAQVTCELALYPNLGHLLTRKLDNQEDDFDPDPAAVADAHRREQRFLMDQGFISIKTGSKAPNR